MKVSIHTTEQSQPIEYDNVENAYSKGGVYCVYLKDTGEVVKYPLCNIFRVKESYN